MAKFTPGPLAGAISGSIGGATFSHNRFGPYMRRRAIPVTSTTPAALAAKAALASGSAAWQLLTAANKLAWNSWALTNPVTNSLGQAQTLTGHQAYTGLHARALSLDTSPQATPPIIPAPAPLTSLTQSCDIGAGTFDLTFAPTPLGANIHLAIRATVVDSPGINFVQNLLRLVGYSAGAQVSPYDHQTLIEARFGTLTVGQSVHVDVAVVDSVSMLLSPPIRVTTIVTTT